MRKTVYGTYPINYRRPITTYVLDSQRPKFVKYANRKTENSDL